MNAEESLSAAEPHRISVPVEFSTELWLAIGEDALAQGLTVDQLINSILSLYYRDDDRLRA